MFEVKIQRAKLQKKIVKNNGFVRINANQNEIKAKNHPHQLPTPIYRGGAGGEVTV